MPVRPRPSAFHADEEPPGVERKFYPLWASRPTMSARGILIHTNGAYGIGTVEAAYNWTTSKWGTNAMPHYQADLSGRAAKFMPSNRKGICNYKADWFFLSIETADLGWGPGDPGGAAEFTPEQIETIAHIVAYEAIVHKFPIKIPTSWDGTGVASHTDPFGYPLWTNVPGKPCPGWRKKEQVREVILPFARIIVNTWLNPDPIPESDKEDLMDYVILPDGDWWPPDYHGGAGPAWFIRFKSGKLIGATKPDFDKAAATPGIGTYYCENSDHYNELLEQSGTTQCAPIK